MLLLILLCIFIIDENKVKHNWKTGHFFIFSIGLFQSKSNDIFLSLQENICLILIRSATQSLMSTHNLCYLGGMRKKNISILLFCGIFLWCGALACAATQSEQDILSHNLCFLGGMRKKKNISILFFFVVFPLMRGISLRIRAVWSGRSFSAYLVFTYATKIPFLMSQYLYKYRSRFTWNVVLLNINRTIAKFGARQSSR